MENGATIFHEASWALNILKPREGQSDIMWYLSLMLNWLVMGLQRQHLREMVLVIVAFNTARFGELVDIGS